jgi:hypothetical protein
MDMWVGTAFAATRMEGRLLPPGSPMRVLRIRRAPAGSGDQQHLLPLTEIGRPGGLGEPGVKRLRFVLKAPAALPIKRLHDAADETLSLPAALSLGRHIGVVLFQLRPTSRKTRLKAFIEDCRRARGGV